MRKWPAPGASGRQAAVKAKRVKPKKQVVEPLRSRKHFHGIPTVRPAMPQA
ncbi:MULTISPECIES: hypothetical protein [unclassified Streptomyces]|uniref:hypothetical protein n=1 Tax=unclassified Streptomyces TaxID=2593676 RepID=UPI0036FE33B3